MNTNTATAPTADPYAEERAERRADSIDTGNAVAHALTRQTGDQWTAHHDDEHGRRHFDLIRSRDGLKLYANGRDDRPPAWHVSACSVTNPADPNAPALRIYDYRNREEPDTSANISRTKPPQQIARDIARRVLAPLSMILARAFRFAGEQYARDGWTKETAAALVAAIPGASYNDGTRSDYPSVTRYGTPYIVAKLDAHDRTIDLRIDGQTPEQVRAILAAVNIPPETPEE